MMSGKLKRYRAERRLPRIEIGRHSHQPAIDHCCLVRSFFWLPSFLVPIYQFAYDKMQAGARCALILTSWPGGSTWRTTLLLPTINRYNHAILENIDLWKTRSRGAESAAQNLPAAPAVCFAAFFDKGNEKAIPGRDGWLHFAPSLDVPHRSAVFYDPDQLQRGLKPA
jgi:hypothetical protein